MDRLLFIHTNVKLNTQVGLVQGLRNCWTDFHASCVDRDRGVHLPKLKYDDLLEYIVRAFGCFKEGPISNEGLSARKRTLSSANVKIVVNRPLLPWDRCLVSFYRETFSPIICIGITLNFCRLTYQWLSCLFRHVSPRQRTHERLTQFDTGSSCYRTTASVTKPL